MFKRNYLNFIFALCVINFLYIPLSQGVNEAENNIQEEQYPTLHEAEAINEIKNQLYDIYNYIIMNNYVLKAENIPSPVVNEIIEGIIDKEYIKNNLLPIVMIQLELKSQNKINHDKALINFNVDFYTAIGFYSSILGHIFFGYSAAQDDGFLTKSFYTLMNAVFAISTAGQLLTLIVRNKLASRRDFIAKTNNMLQEKKIEMNNVLINLLITALEEKVKLYI